MENKKEIKKLVDLYQKAIHSQNEKEFKSLWAKSTQNILISITHSFIGIDSIYNDFLIRKIQENYSYIELITENIDISFINENLAIVIFQYHTECILRDTNEPYGIQGIETQVVIKEEGQWKITHIHYSK